MPCSLWHSKRRLWNQTNVQSRGRSRYNASYYPWVLQHSPPVLDDLRDRNKSPHWIAGPFVFPFQPNHVCCYCGCCADEQTVKDENSLVLKLEESPSTNGSAAETSNDSESPHNAPFPHRLKTWVRIKRLHIATYLLLLPCTQNLHRYPNYLLFSIVAYYR